ncbi:hypothetical protein ZIOFF_046144 [Zingiber officinale]|uniref:Uncharacterized protein n=1 Tax=Zingiber officinale TaxID=94328 RepID=A0A8J5G4I8_ZINOF|nr:hypothetical protein ZIOFF_046144 [Zingiber officinale]
MCSSGTGDIAESRRSRYGNEGLWSKAVVVAWERTVLVSFGVSREQHLCDEPSGGQSGRMEVDPNLAASNRELEVSLSGDFWPVLLYCRVAGGNADFCPPGDRKLQEEREESREQPIAGYECDLERPKVLLFHFVSFFFRQVLLRPSARHQC